MTATSKEGGRVMGMNRWIVHFSDGSQINNHTLFFATDLGDEFFKVSPHAFIGLKNGLLVLNGTFRQFLPINW